MLEVALLILLLAFGFAGLGYMVGMALDGYAIGTWRFRMPAWCEALWEWLHERPEGYGQVLNFPATPGGEDS